MTVTVIDCKIFKVVLRDVDDGIGVLTFCLVFALTRLRETEDGVRTIHLG